MNSDRVHMGLRRVRVFTFIFLILGVWLGGKPGEMAAAADPAVLVFSVTTQDDLSDEQPGDGNCTITDSILCSLRAAIQEANEHAKKPDCTNGNCSTQIYVPAGTYNLGDQLVIGVIGDPTFTGRQPNVFIEGAGAGQTVLDGNRATRVMDITSGAIVRVRGVMVQNGRAVQSDVVDTHYHGGGIHNHGTLILENSALSGNNASAGPAANCVGPCGGGLYNAGLATLINVTIAYNNANAGGGIANSGHLDLYNATLANNLAPNGGGLYNTGPGTATLFSTIVANNDGIGPGNNCSWTTNRPQGGGDNLQISYSAPDPQSCGTSIPVADPGLDPVQNADGAAIYYRLYSWSPAIDIVPQRYAGIDQRGAPRPQDGNGDGIARGDAGAYERRPIDP